MYYRVYNIPKRKMYFPSTKDEREWWVEILFCKLLILNMKWYNIIWQEKVYTVSPKTGFSTSALLTLWAGRFFAVKGCLVCCRMCSSSPSLHPLDVPIVVTENTFKCPLARETKLPRWEPLSYTDQRK